MGYIGYATSTYVQDEHFKYNNSPIHYNQWTVSIMRSAIVLWNTSRCNPDTISTHLSNTWNGMYMSPHSKPSWFNPLILSSVMAYPFPFPRLAHLIFETREILVLLHCVHISHVHDSLWILAVPLCVPRTTCACPTIQRRACPIPWFYLQW